MGAAFEFKGYLCWGSNGMIADYLEQMAQAATIAANPENELAWWLNHQHQNFYPGAVFVLDDILLSDEIVTQFVTLLDETTNQFLESSRFNEMGKRWLCEKVPSLKSHLRREQ